MLAASPSQVLRKSASSQETARSERLKRAAQKRLSSASFPSCLESFFQASLSLSRKESEEAKVSIYTGCALNLETNCRN